MNFLSTPDDRQLAVYDPITGDEQNDVFRPAWHGEYEKRGPRQKLRRLEE
jgi:hypothetical protein